MRRMSLMAALIILGVAEAAQAATGPDPRLELTFEQTTVAAGSTVGFTGSGCFDVIPAEGARVRAFRTELPTFDFAVSTPVAADGGFAGELMVPADAPAGQYSVNANCLEADAPTGPRSSRGC